jgi:hypothetical protein
VAAALLTGSAGLPRLLVKSSAFMAPGGRPFEWRGITAFRLVEFMARGREREADDYLAWAASKKLNVVRVLAMADVLFKLAPAEGRLALPRLLDLANRHGIYVEVVALADTARITVDVRQQVKAIGEICGRHPNALVEIANEPSHPTQAKTLHDPGYVASLRSLIPGVVPVSLGSVESGEGYGRGDYVTWHSPRSNGDWPTRMAEGAALVKTYGKPVVNDEPMGAADVSTPGRRDSEPAHFRQAAIAARRAGIGMTFHYEGGLQAKRPSAKEMACLDAWLEGLSAAR